MTADSRATKGALGFEPLLEIALGVEVFSSNWAHCDRIATYIARQVSHTRRDSLLYANLFSSALNELLETAFRAHRGQGKLACSVSRAGAVDRIELTIPCDAALKSFYAEAVDGLTGKDVGERYVEALLADRALDPAIGLLELAVDYKARFSLHADEGDAVRLVADLALEDTE
jgi:hypothetical protein